MANTQTGLNKRLLLERGCMGCLTFSLGILVGINFANVASRSNSLWLWLVPYGLSGASIVLGVVLLLKLRPMWRADQEKPADG